MRQRAAAQYVQRQQNMNTDATGGRVGGVVRSSPGGGEGGASIQLGKGRVFMLM